MVFFSGTLVGGLNTLYFFPDVLTPDQIGLIRTFEAFALLCTPFILMGGSGLAIRFFPKFQTKDNRHHGFLPILLFLAGIGLSLFLFFFFYFQDQIVAYYQADSPLIGTFYPYLLPITIGIALTALLFQYTTNFLLITVPQLIKQSIKVLMMVLALMMLFSGLGYDDFVKVVAVWYLIIPLLLIAYLIYLGQWKLKLDLAFLTKPLKKEMRSYAFFGVLASLGSLLITSIDLIMVTGLTELSESGVYSIAGYIAGVIAIPISSIILIAGPIISKAWNEKNHAEIDMVYKKSSLNLSLIGLLFILIITASISDIFDFMPNGELYRSGVNIIFLLMGARFFDMLTSVNNEIIGYSKYYRVSFYSLLAVGLLNIGLNVLFINAYGKVGAAVATFISLGLFNLFKLAFIYLKFGFHPFSIGTAKLLVIAAFVFLISLIPIQTQHPILNIILKTSIIAPIYLLLTFKWTISEDFNGIVTSTFSKWIGKKR